LTAERQAWIEEWNLYLKTTYADVVIDMYSALIDPDVGYTLLPAFDSGDHLHPSGFGYSLFDIEISRHIKIFFGIGAALDQTGFGIMHEPATTNLATNHAI